MNFRISDGRPQISIITTAANDTMGQIQNLLPFIMSSHNEAMAWIREPDKKAQIELMQPASNDALIFTPVSAYVNKSSNDGPECIEPVGST